MKMVIIGLCLLLMATAAHGQESFKDIFHPSPVKVAQGQESFQEGLQPSPAKMAQPMSLSGSNDESTPKPDPTRITTEAIAALKQQLLELFGTKFDSVIKELDKLSKRLDDRPAEVTDTIAHLEKLMGEKFKGVDQQFQGRDVALAAALLAQKTSVADQNNSNLIAADKAEKAFIEQIKGIQSLLLQQDKAASDKINDLKDRLTAIESRGEGAGSVITWIFGGAAFFMTMLSIVGAVVAMMKSNQAERAAAAVAAVNGYKK